MECICESDISQHYLSKEDEEIAKRRNREIKRTLKRDRKEEMRVHKILLLGTGESGKSTIKKQMQIIHKEGFTMKERLEKIPEIKRNIRESIINIVGAMDEFNLSTSQENEESKRYILEEATQETFKSYTQEFYDHTKKLWQDDGVQDSYSRSSEYQLIDCAKYFLDRINEIQDPDYVPTDQDILRCRVVTTKIQQIDFTIKERDGTARFSAFDVGGQRGERRKWIQVFDRSTAIVFLVDIGSFDMRLREEPTKNRLLESLQIFDKVWNNRFLRRVSIILFLNKIDILTEKIANGRSMKDYVKLIQEELDEDITCAMDQEEKDRLKMYYKLFGQFKTDYRHEAKKFEEDKKVFLKHHPCKDTVTDEGISTAVFVKDMFMKIAMEKRVTENGEKWHAYHSCEYFYTCAIDTDNIRNVLEGCRTIIIKKHLERLSISGH